MADQDKNPQAASITTTADTSTENESNGHSHHDESDSGLSYEERAAYAEVDPGEEEELVTTDDLLQDGDPKSRGAENSPLPRTLIVLGGVGLFAIIIWLISSLFTGGGQQQVADTDEALPEETTGSFAEDDRLRAELALVEQGRGEPQPRIAETPQEPQQETSEETVEVEPTPSSPPPSMTSSRPEPPPPSPPAPAPSPVQAAPLPPAAEPEPEIDPLEQWSRLSNLGATGQQVALAAQEIQEDENSSSTTTTSNTQNRREATRQSRSRQSRFSSDTIGDDPISRPDDEQMTGARALSGTVPRRASQFQLVSNQLTRPQQTTQSTPQSLVSSSPGTQGILQQRRPTEQIQQQRRPQTRQVQIGSSAEGEMTVPMVYAGGDGVSQGRSAVTLTRPLLDINGEIALPEGTILITELRSVSPSNIVGLDVIAIIYEDRNGNIQQEEIQPGILEIRGEDNEALIAESETPGSDSFGDDLLAGLLGAAGRVGEYLIAPDSTSTSTASSGGGSTSTSTTTTVSNQDRDNVAAAALAGFFRPVAERVSERSQNDSNDLQPYLEVEEGEDVSVYVRGLLEVQI